jgi:hypothetical protein
LRIDRFVLRNLKIAAPSECAYDKHEQECELDTFSELIEKEFEQRPPHSINEARSRIHELTGILRSLTQVTEFLKKRISLPENRKR